MLQTKNKKGFTLVELIVGVAVFTVLVVSVYGAYQSIFKVVSASRSKIAAIDLINEQLEIIRNMPYADVGIAGSIPSGLLVHSKIINRDSINYSVLTTVRNIDDPFDGTIGGTPNDTSPSDYRLVEIEVSCVTCQNLTPIIVTTRVAPKNLEGASTNGALFIKALDASGNPVPDASVHIENNSISPKITVDDVTNNAGLLQILDVPPGNSVYEITVTKNGFSTEKTYNITNPVKPHATVVLQQVTQVSFIIDKVSTFNVSSVSDTCSAVSNFPFTLQGIKQISANPLVLKYNKSATTDSSGILTLPNMEWDTYTLTSTSTAYDIIGINPPGAIVLSPNITQNLGLIVSPRNSKTLLVTVRDYQTGLPLSGASVEISNGSPIDTLITGQGFINQTDWSGGSGQATSTDLTRYFSSDGNMNVSNPTLNITLNKVMEEYVPSGVLTSSSFDTGSAVNFQQLDWNPSSQPIGSNVRFQIATSNDGGTWDFLGPDGTSATYYTTSNKNISSINNGHRYLRYKLFLDTTSTISAPNLSNISFTFTSACTPPGQVAFRGLDEATYTLTVSKSGYVTQVVSVPVSPNWQSTEVILQPN